MFHFHPIRKDDSWQVCNNLCLCYFLHPIWCLPPSNGFDGAFNALMVGAVYQGLFLYFKRNLWASIICHGVYNTIVMTLIYLGHL